MPIPANYAAPVYLSAKDRAFQQIQEWIIDGTFQPGEKINDTELAKAIGVSRTPVREALQMLSLHGFVSMKPGVATTICDTEPGEITKLFPPLAALEGIAAELAAPVIQAEDLAALRALNEQFAAAIHSGDTFTALKVDEQLHDRIVRLCDNRYLENAIAPMQAHVRHLFFQQAVILTEKSIHEHTQLIEALERHDVDEASRVARANWLRPIQEYAAAHPEQ